MRDRTPCEHCGQRGVAEAPQHLEARIGEGNAVRIRAARVHAPTAEPSCLIERGNNVEHRGRPACGVDLQLGGVHDDSAQTLPREAGDEGGGLRRVVPGENRLIALVRQGSCRRIPRHRAVPRQRRVDFTCGGAVEVAVGRGAAADLVVVDAEHVVRDVPDTARARLGKVPAVEPGVCTRLLDCQPYGAGVGLSFSAARGNRAEGGP
mmetsp:Transcript_86139/g.248726  ORF Transcript_86139/g.248726 Transcript_86139/m.248726 type:complete len:207 (+) Transcript_86139:1629-2249(+)